MSNLKQRLGRLERRHQAGAPASFWWYDPDSDTYSGVGGVTVPGADFARRSEGGRHVIFERFHDPATGRCAPVGILPQT